MKDWLTTSTTSFFRFLKPFDNEYIIAGQGSFGLEACQFFMGSNINPDIVLSCTSGGGLVAGTSIAFKHYFLVLFSFFARRRPPALDLATPRAWTWRW